MFAHVLRILYRRCSDVMLCDVSAFREELVHHMPDGGRADGLPRESCSYPLIKRHSRLAIFIKGWSTCTPPLLCRANDTPPRSTTRGAGVVVHTPPARKRFQSCANLPAIPLLLLLGHVHVSFACISNRFPRSPDSPPDSMLLESSWQSL